jgi:hypothetical protein
MPANQDLCDLANSLCNTLTARGELDIVKTSHFAAVYAKEMWVCRILPMLIVSNRFESPNVVS